MGTEILDFDEDRAADSASSAGTADPVDGPRPVDVVNLDPSDLDHSDLDHSDDAEPSPRGPRNDSLTAVRRWVATLRADRAARRRLAGALVLLLFVVVVTATVVQQRASSAAAQVESARLAVDVSVDQAPSVEDPAISTAPRGQSFLPLKLHNLGRRPVHLTGLLYRLTEDPEQNRTLVSGDTRVAAGQLLNREYPITLPCGPTPETAVTGPATMSALVRTADGVTHVVPVDLTALDQLGGVFAACSVYAHTFGAYNADSQVEGTGVRITLTMPSVELVGSNFVELDVYREGLPADIAFVATPRLPERARAGTRVSVELRPVVTRCPKGMDLTVLPALGLRIGGDTYPDPYLPLLVAQAVGRACR